MGTRLALGRLRAMIDWAPMAMISYGPEMTIIEWNQAAAHLLGVAARDAIGRSVCDFFLENDETGPRRWKRMAWASGSADARHQGST